MTRDPATTTGDARRTLGVLLRIGSGLALLWTIAPPCLFVAGAIGLDAAKLHMLLGTAGWFLITPFWMWHPDPSATAEPG